MLGDASISKWKNNITFKFTQSNKHTIYFKFVLNIFCNVVSSVNFNRPIKNTPLFYHSLHFDVTEDQRFHWYPNDTKSISNDIKITPIVLSFWICDDGSDVKSGGTILNTQCFTHHDIELLRTKLADIGLHNTTLQRSGPILYIEKCDSILVNEMCNQFIVKAIFIGRP
jgi:hypothetical protein